MEHPNQHDRDQRLHEIEQSLISRIADVDDDRRRTASALHRAMETLVEEMDEKLRRSRRTTATFAAVASLIALTALWFGLRPPATGDAAIAGELAQMKQDVARITAVSADDELLHRKLTGLSESVSDLSAALGVLEVERTERQAADADLAERLEDTISEIAALRAALAEAMPLPGPAPTEIGHVSQVSPEQPESAPSQQTRSPATTTDEAAPEQLQTQVGGASDLIETVADVAELAGTTMARPAEAHSDGEKDASERPTDASPLADATIDAPAVDPKPIEDAGTPIAVRAEESDPAPSVDESGVIIEDRGYALQLIGFYSLEALREFADRDDLPNQLYYRRESLRRRPWYVLIHSLHKDAATATAVRSTLPSDLAALDIWIRPLSKGTQLEILDLDGNTH